MNVNAVDNYKILETMTDGKNSKFHKVYDQEQKISSKIISLMQKLENNELLHNVIQKHFWGCDSILQGEKAFAEKNTIPLVLKILNEEPTDEAYEVFEKYFAQALKFKHHNIINIHDMGIFDKKLYYVFEYVEGTCVKKEIESCGAYFEPTACRIIHQILQSLEHLHTHGFVHGNISSQGIILANNTKPKLHVRSYCAAKNDSWGIINPTKKTTQLNDIKDLAVVFYEMLTGKMHCGNLEISSLDISNDVKEILEKMFTTYDNCKDIHEDLQKKDLLSVKF